MEDVLFSFQGLPHLIFFLWRAIILIKRPGNLIFLTFNISIGLYGCWKSPYSERILGLIFAGFVSY